MQTLFSRLSIAGIVLVGILGCQQKAAIWIEEGSTANRLVFGVGMRRGDNDGWAISSLVVSRCEAAGREWPEGIVWSVTAQPGAPAGRLRQVPYGEAPAGFVVDVEPQRLSSGCYRADIHGGHVVFDVKPDGRVVEREEE